MVGTEAPAFDVGEDTMNQWQLPTGSRRADNLNIMLFAVQFGISEPSAPEHSGTPDNDGSDECAQAVGRRVGDYPKPGSGGTTFADRVGAADCRFLVMPSASTIVLLRFVKRGLHVTQFLATSDA